MAIIKKKISPKYFDLIKLGKKKFELRLADFRIKQNDVLVLEEWNPKTKKYTGRKIKRTAKYIFRFHLNDFAQEKQIKKNGFYVIQF